MSEKVLVTDFDGTITRRDFYTCVLEQLLQPEDVAPWTLYTTGRITHFEALRRIFARIRVDEAALDEVLEAMAIEPDLGWEVRRLREAGWAVVVVSNGCQWYVDRMLERAGVSVPVHANPGNFDPASGLTMELPAESPHFDPEVGVSKAAVVQDHLDRGATVAFAGDGRPDVAPALLVPAERRFARGWLAGHLEDQGVTFHRYKTWSEVAEMLVFG